MLEFLCKILFCLSMLAVYRYVTSTNELIVVVVGYIACVFSYYYFDIIRGAIDNLLNYFNVNGRVNETISQPRVSGYFVNKKCTSKLGTTPVVPVMSPVANSKMFNALCSASGSGYQKENLMVYGGPNKLELQSSTRMKPEYKDRAYIPTPVIKTNNVLINRSNGTRSKVYFDMDFGDKPTYNDAKVDVQQDQSNYNEMDTEEIRNENYLQALKEISRKRNYIQEETDRSGSTPKKSRKNEVKRNVTFTQQKRTHNDCSNDSIEEEKCKKRCEAKYKRTHEDSTNDSPEDNRKSRKKRCDDSDRVVERVYKIDPDEESESDFSSNELPPLSDEEGEYIRVAGGKILNRTNCMYKRKLKHNKIDPISVITTQPELVNGIHERPDGDEETYIDDEMMKENLLKSLMDDIERKGERDESVIFFQNSIIEEIAKRNSKPESQQPEGAKIESSLSSILKTPAATTAAPSLNLLPTVTFNSSLITSTNTTALSSVSTVTDTVDAPVEKHTNGTSSVIPSAASTTSTIPSFGTFSAPNFASTVPTFKATVSASSSPTTFANTVPSFKATVPASSSPSTPVALVSPAFPISTVAPAQSNASATATPSSFSTSATSPFTVNTKTTPQFSSGTVASPFAMTTTAAPTAASPFSLSPASAFNVASKPSSVSPSTFSSSIAVPTFAMSSAPCFGSATSFGATTSTAPTFSSSSTPPSSTFSTGTMSSSAASPTLFSAPSATTTAASPFNMTSKPSFNASAMFNAPSTQTSFATTPAPTFGSFAASSFGTAPSLFNASAATTSAPTFNTTVTPPSSSTFSLNTGASPFTSSTSSPFNSSTSLFGVSNATTTAPAFGLGTKPAFSVSGANFNTGTSSPSSGFSTSSAPTFGSLSTPTFGSTSFGAAAPIATSTTVPAFNTSATSASPFGISSTPSFSAAASTPASAFNIGTGQSTFSFSAGSNAFGGATAAAKPAENLFTFGSAASAQPNVAAQPAQPTGSVFQFGGASMQPSQPFAFGAGTAPTVMFTNGTGGGASTARATARRSRRK